MGISKTCLNRRRRAWEISVKTLITAAVAECVFFSASAQMRPIPGGSFLMGTREGKQNETPEHQVELAPFLLDAFEVTNAQFDSCVRAGVCSPAHDSDGQCVAWNGRNFIRVRIQRLEKDARLPVACVTWNQAKDYCAFKGKKLPSEAQWEYAALAGRRVAYSWGNESPDAKRCVQAEEGKPKKAGSFAANPWGLFDMTGNVWEWVNDRYQSDYYPTSDAKDPQGPDAGQYRVIRGGGWYSGAEQLRIKNRHWFEPNFGEISIGFRCAK